VQLALRGHWDLEDLQVELVLLVLKGQVVLWVHLDLEGLPAHLALQVNLVRLAQLDPLVQEVLKEIEDRSVHLGLLEPQVLLVLLDLLDLMETQEQLEVLAPLALVDPKDKMDQEVLQGLVGSQDLMGQLEMQDLEDLVDHQVLEVPLDPQDLLGHAVDLVTLGHQVKRAPWVLLVP